MKYLLLLLLTLNTLADTTITSSGGSKFIVYGVDGREEIEVSSHSTQHKAIESAINWIEKNCPIDTRCTAYVRQDFQLVITKKGNIVLPDEPEEPPTSIGISFCSPTERENGDILTSSEIGGYEIVFFHDELESVTFILPHEVIKNDYTYSMETEEPDSWSVKVAAFDTNGLYSKFAEAVESDEPRESCGEVVK